MKRLFISMVLVMSAQLSMVAANTYTVYFDNSKSNWDTVYAWIWDADNGDKNYTGGTWPGTLMTLNSDGLYEYTFTTDDNPTGLKVIFAEKDGGEQTSDLTFVNGDTYDVTGDEAAAEQTWTVYYDNSESAWTTVYAYIWADGNAQPLGGWPGTVMTKNTDGTWMLTFTTKYDLVNAYIMFDDGAGNPADTDETDGNGFAFENGATYNYEGKTSSGSSSGNTGGTGETVESYTVTFTDNGSPAWSTVYIYVYDANTTEPCGAWPGTVMTSANGSWTFTVESDVQLTNPEVIFNDGAANSTASDQTAAFDLIDGDTYTRDGDTNAATQTWTVTFTDDGATKWTTVYAYIWDDNNSHPLGDWPGTAMTSAGNNTWTLTFTTKYDLVNPMIMFDDGANNPTDDDETDGNGYAYTNGGSYTRSGGTTGGNTEDDNSGSTGETVESYTVTFTDNGSPAWSTVYIYVYDANTTEPCGAWPGTVMTSANGSWTFTVNSDVELTSPKVIFNDGAAESTASDQTSAFDLVSGDSYTRDGDTNAATQTWTVTFTDDGSTKWSTVYAYIWDDSNNKPLGDWPGTAMTSAGNNTWTLTFTTKYDLVNPMIMFDDGASEPTDDDETDGNGYAYTNGGSYTRSDTGTSSGNGNTGGTGETVETYTVTFTDNGSPAWSTVYIYVYDANTTEPCGAWPGTVMTSANGSWTFTVNSDVELTSPKVIFNDGAAESTASDQTSAFDLVSGDTYTRDGDTNAATQTWTVTFTDDGSPVWSSVYAYIWDDNNSHPLGDWPGTAMTSAGNNTWTLTFTTKYDLVNPLIMFDDGAAFPGDLDETDANGFAYTNGGSYKRSDTGVSNGGGSTGGGTTGEIMETYTVTFTDNGSPAWSTVYIYVYDANTTEPCGAWPGTKMTQSGSSWTYTVECDVMLTNPKVIFNDGALESTANDQTSAFDLVSGDSYTRDGDTSVASQTWTVTFVDDGTPAWTIVYAYIWDDNVSQPLGAWPGTAMTSAGNNTWTLTFETKYDLVNPLIIFDDGESLDPTENDETDPDGMAYVNGGIYNRETQTGTDNSGSGTENGGSGTENGGTETGINGVAAPGGADVIYTLQGMKVTNTSKKGVYIINGRKVVK